MELEKIIQYVKENKNYFILGTIIVLGLLFGPAEARDRYGFTPVEKEPNAAVMRVLLESNGATKVVSFQCNDISECAERIAERMNSKGTCNPQVKKIMLEEVYIDGM